MKKFKVTLSRTLNWEVEVTADSKEEAKELIDKMVESGEIADNNAQAGYIETHDIEETDESYCPNLKNNELVVKTPIGSLRASDSGDVPEYQGISVYLEDEMVASVEYEKDKGLRVFTYGDMTSEDPTHIEEIRNIEMQLHILNSDTNR